MRVPRRPLSLRGRLITALLVFSAVGLVLFGGASMLLLRHYLLNRVDQQLLHFSEFQPGVGLRIQGGVLAVHRASLAPSAPTRQPLFQ